MFQVGGAFDINSGAAEKGSGVEKTWRERERERAMTMKPDGAGVRQVGQRRLPISFSAGPKSPSKEGGQIRSSKKLVSLSDFLDRKLGKTTPAATNKPVQEKGRCFSSAQALHNLVGTKRVESERRCILDGAVFRQFNPTVRGEECVSSRDDDEVGGESQFSSWKDGRSSRKRKNTFVDSDGKDEGTTAPKLLLVLGDDPKPRHKRREQIFMGGGGKHLFNHYATGGGWWDSDREGVDSEEVGCNEVWEGMGCTTVGGLEWH